MSALSTLKHSFYDLNPEQVLQAIESLGLVCNGYQLSLNSYENRVYQIGLEKTSPEKTSLEKTSLEKTGLENLGLEKTGVENEATLIAKFYRPNRWSDAAILEEHDFTLELQALDIPVVAPLCMDGHTLHSFKMHRFALYPLQAGRAPDLENKTHLQQLGRFFARIHALGAETDFQHRPALNVFTFGDDAYEYLMEHAFLPPELEKAYACLAEDLLLVIEQVFDAVDARCIRLHGDGHPGNILWKHGSPYMVDFDDARMGPAIQDLWMFLSGDRSQMTAALDTVLSAYSQFYDFNRRELALIEPLRTLRMMHHAAWLAERWTDPAFQRAFPWFNTQQFWEGHILSLKEQAWAMQEAPLQWL